MAHLIYACTFCDRNFFKIDTVKEHLFSSATCKENGASYREEIKKLWQTKPINTITSSMVHSSHQVNKFK